MQLSYYAITSSGKWLNNKLICLKINCNQVSALLLHYSPGPDLCQAEYLPTRCSWYQVRRSSLPRQRSPAAAGPLQSCWMAEISAASARNARKRIRPPELRHAAFTSIPVCILSVLTKDSCEQPLWTTEEGGIEMNEVTVSTAADKETSVDVAALPV